MRVEKRAMSIICPGLLYQETIELAVLLLDPVLIICIRRFLVLLAELSRAKRAAEHHG